MDEQKVIDLKQDFPPITYLAPLISFAIFFFIAFILSVTIINWFCVRSGDDVTVLEEWGYKRNLPVRLGPHRRSVVARNVGKHMLEEE